MHHAPSARNRRLPLLVTTAVAMVAAVSIGATAWNAGAADEPAGSNTVTIDPVRILDSRDGTDVGLDGPFASGTSQPLTVTGLVDTTDGPATVVPAGATGVVLTATVLNSTSAGFVSVRPGTASGEPATSNLNFTGGQVLANSVTVALPTSGPDAGEIDIFFRGGGPSDRADLLIDVVAYLTDGPSGTEIAGVEPPGSTELDDNEIDTVATLVFDAPSDGNAVVNAAASVSDMIARGKLFCSIGTGTSLASPAMAWESAGPNGSIGQISGSRLMAVTEGVNTFRFVCQSRTSSGPEVAFVSDPTLTLVFVAD
ncbi:MAG: hypothetical protein ACR2O6_03295 [Ilumatobacteraceae bacterium]